MTLRSLSAGPDSRASIVECLPRWLGCLLFIAVLGSLQGCAVNRTTASVTPNQDITPLKIYYVVQFDADQRGIHRLIVDDLRRRGLTATTGPEANVPKNVDAVVSYVDKWMWDITMYMLELTVYVRDPASQVVLATGNSYHTSLSRLPPDEMVKEVLDNIFAQTGSAASRAPLPRSASDSMVLAIPPYAAVVPVPGARLATVRMDPVRDLRKDATGSLVGERSVFGMSMGKVEMSPLPVEMVGQVLRSELAAKGVLTTISEEEVTLRPRLAKFDLRTPSTALYWDMNGVIALELEMTGRDGRAQERRY